MSDTSLKIIPTAPDFMLLLHHFRLVPTWIAILLVFLAALGPLGDGINILFIRARLKSRGNDRR